VWESRAPPDLIRKGPARRESGPFNKFLQEDEHAMIEVGKQAPEFELVSNLAGKKYSLGQFKGQKNVMLVFYPLDWTPT
jgi:hypothetical protein